MAPQVQKNPAPAVPWLLGGAAVMAGAMYWVLRSTGEEAETRATEGAKTDPVPKADLIDPDALSISADCQNVTLGNTWSANVAFPAIQQQVQQLSRGLSLYPVTLRGRAVDVVVREVLSPYGACIQTAVWRDLYMENVPFPVIEQIFTAPVARQAIDAWNAGWGAAWQAWAAQNLQLSALIVALRWMTRDTYLYNLGVDLHYKPVDTGQYPPGLTPADKDRLMLLGYDLNMQAVQSFQTHYNLAKNYETENQWNGASLNLAEDNVINNETRDALLDAAYMQVLFGNWMGLVETAINA